MKEDAHEKVDIVVAGSGYNRISPQRSIFGLNADLFGSSVLGSI